MMEAVARALPAAVPRASSLRQNVPLRSTRVTRSKRPAATTTPSAGRAGSGGFMVGRLVSPPPFLTRAARHPASPSCRTGAAAGGNCPLCKGLGGGVHEGHEAAAVHDAGPALQQPRRLEPAGAGAGEMQGLLERARDRFRRHGAMWSACYTRRES